jgi:hypothetical protein
MRQSFPDIERRLAQNAADLRSRMAEMQKLRLAEKRAEAWAVSASSLSRMPTTYALPPGSVKVRRACHGGSCYPYSSTSWPPLRNTLVTVNIGLRSFFFFEALQTPTRRNEATLLHWAIAGFPLSGFTR